VPPAGRSSTPSVRPTASTPDAFERELGALRARLELLIARVEKLEKMEREERKADDLGVRVVALESKLAQGTGLAIRIAALEAELTRSMQGSKGAASGSTPGAPESCALAARVAMIEAELVDDIAVTARVTALEAKLETAMSVAMRIAAVVAELGRGLAASRESIEKLAQARVEPGAPPDAQATETMDAILARLAALEAAASTSARPNVADSRPERTPRETRDTVETPSADDLRRIKGIGPKFAKALRAAGVTHFRQIAAWSDQDVATIADRIGANKDRIARDGWVESARALLDE
jgi:predicted flap endonuclease-1-like 5' DNA nuclease